MSLKRLLLISLVLSIYNCCKSPDRTNQIILNDWIGKKIILPESPNKVINKGKVKLVTRINGGCATCILRLKHWSKFIEQVGLESNCPDVQFYFYVVSSDTAFFNEINKTEIHFEHPVVFDKNNMFHELNGLHHNSLYHTMLLDSMDNVLLIGTPLNNKKMQRLYTEEINRICSK